MTSTNKTPPAKLLTEPEVLQMLPKLKWPLAVKDFAEATHLKRTTAQMRLTSLKAKGHIRQLPSGLYGLPGEVYPSEAGELPLIEQARERLPELNWPMTSAQFARTLDLPVSDSTKFRWFRQFVEEDLLREVGERLFAYAGARVELVAETPLYEGESDLRQRFAQVLLTLPETFTSVQFQLAADVDSKHANTVLSRLEKAGKLTRLGRGKYRRPFTPLETTFSAGRFRHHFGLSSEQAMNLLEELVAGGRLTRLPNRDYLTTPAVIEELEQTLHDADAVPFDYARMRERQAEVPDLAWPMTVKDYAEVYGISVAAARMTLDRFVLIGLLVNDGKEVRAYRYTLAPDRPLFRISPREAQEQVSGHKATRRATRPLPSPRPV